MKGPTMGQQATQQTGGGVFVSLETIYAQQQATQQAVQQLAGDVKAALDLEQRVRDLERDQAAADKGSGPAGTPTTVAALSALLTSVGTAVWQMMHGG